MSQNRMLSLHTILKIVYRVPVTTLPCLNVNRYLTVSARNYYKAYECDIVLRTLLIGHYLLLNWYFVYIEQRYDTVKYVCNINTQHTFKNLLKPNAL